MKTEVLDKWLVVKFKSTFITPTTYSSTVYNKKNIFNNNKTTKASETLNTRYVDSRA